MQKRNKSPKMKEKGNKSPHRIWKVNEWKWKKNPIPKIMRKIKKKLKLTALASQQSSLVLSQ